MAGVAVTVERARRIAVRAQALDGSASDVLGLVRRLGFLQMDPIAVVARPEHLVLYSRLGRVAADELDRLLWQERKLFEWDAHIWPVEDLPLVRARMRRRRSHPPARDREFLSANRGLRRQVLRELERHGPVLSRHLGNGGLRTVAPSEHRWWGSGRLRLMLDILQARGEVAVAGREGGQRLWDLAERVYGEGEAIPWREAVGLIEEKRRRALGVWLERGRLMALPGACDDPVPERITFLSPFDQLIHDRRRALALFGFRYRLEMYVPAAKRQYGYYVLPILHGERIAGRIDVVRERPSGTLRVGGLWWEDGIDPVPIDDALDEMQRALSDDFRGRGPSNPGDEA
jgi:uncharacterized protein YcaQ